MPNLLNALSRIAEALERLSPPETSLPDFAHPAYQWCSKPKQFQAVSSVKTIPFDCLVGIDRQAQTLLQNSLGFAQGKRANHALLWGAKGMGKSSLIKAVFEKIRLDYEVFLIEIKRDNLADLAELMHLFRLTDKRIFLFCDDLSFEYDEAIYKSLKAALDGGIEGCPDNVLFYASSNRRHLLSSDQIENERQAEIHDGESIEEKVSLSDRFGLWLGFYPANQDEYFEMIRRYLDYFDIKTREEVWKPEAIEWSMTRGARSGRVAWQFVTAFLAKV